MPDVPSIFYLPPPYSEEPSPIYDLCASSISSEMLTNLCMEAVTCQQRSSTFSSLAKEGCPRNSPHHAEQTDNPIKEEQEESSSSNNDLTSYTFQDQ